MQKNDLFFQGSIESTSELLDFPELDRTFSRLKELQQEYIFTRIEKAEKALAQIENELQEFLRL